VQEALALAAATRLNLLSESALMCKALINLVLMGALAKMDGILSTDLARLRAHPGDMACRAAKSAAFCLLNRSRRGSLSNHGVDIRRRDSLMKITINIHDDFSRFHIRTLILIGQVH
jgi:hypothetical protein